jgi:excisionase family DNA binding protein
LPKSKSFSESEPDRILLLREAQQRLRVHRATLYRLIRDGHIKAFTIARRSRRITESELQRFIKSRIEASQ